MTEKQSVNVWKINNLKRMIKEYIDDKAQSQLYSMGNRSTRMAVKSFADYIASSFSDFAKEIERIEDLNVQRQALSYLLAELQECKTMFCMLIRHDSGIRDFTENEIDDHLMKFKEHYGQIFHRRNGEEISRTEMRDRAERDLYSIHNGMYKYKEDAYNIIKETYMEMHKNLTNLVNVRIPLMRAFTDISPDAVKKNNVRVLLSDFLSISDNSLKDILLCRIRDSAKGKAGKGVATIVLALQKLNYIDVTHGEYFSLHNAIRDEVNEHIGTYQGMQKYLTGCERSSITDEEIERVIERFRLE